FGAHHRRAAHVQKTIRRFSHYCATVCSSLRCPCCQEQRSDQTNVNAHFSSSPQVFGKSSTGDGTGNRVRITKCQRASSERNVPEYGNKRKNLNPRDVRNKTRQADKRRRTITVCGAEELAFGKTAEQVVG